MPVHIQQTHGIWKKWFDSKYVRTQCVQIPRLIDIIILNTYQHWTLNMLSSLSFTLWRSLTWQFHTSYFFFFNHSCDSVIWSTEEEEQTVKRQRSMAQLCECIVTELRSQITELFFFYPTPVKSSPDQMMYKPENNMSVGSELAWWGK